MKRYNVSQKYGFQAMEPNEDGEWMRYSDHVEEMKRVAVDPRMEAIAAAEKQVEEAAERRREREERFGIGATPVAQGLTDEQIIAIAAKSGIGPSSAMEFARAILAQSAVTESLQGTQEPVYQVWYVNSGGSWHDVTKEKWDAHYPHPRRIMFHVEPRLTIKDPAIYQHKFTGELHAFDSLDDPSEYWVPVEEATQGEDEGRRLLRDQMRRTIEAQDECARLRAELAELRASASQAVPALTDEQALDISIDLGMVRKDYGGYFVNKLTVEEIMEAIRSLCTESPAAPIAAETEPMAWLFVKSGKKMKIFVRAEASELLDGHYPLFGQSASQLKRHVPQANEQFIAPKLELLAQAAPSASAPECDTCNGSVHVHDATGEYRGECPHCTVPTGDDGKDLRNRCAELVDIYDDAQNNPPESRCYVEGAYGETVAELRGLLLPAAAPSASAQQAEPVEELAMMVRLLVHALRKAAPANPLSARAVGYLKRHGLQGSVLRAAPAPTALKESP